MEAVLGLIGIIVFFAGINFVFRLIGAGLSSAGKAVTGQGKFSDNMHAQLRGMGPFQIELRRQDKNDADQPFDVIEVYGKGLIPLPSGKSKNIRFITSVIDSTDEKKKPILSTVEGFQEIGTIAFQHSVDGGHVNKDEGYISWVRVGTIIPEILVPPSQGSREVLVVTRIVDANINPAINEGFHSPDRDPAILGSFYEKFTYVFQAKGYEESADERDRASSLSVELAVAVAMSDGSIDEAEAKVISQWIEKSLSILSGKRREKVKSSCNEAFKSAYKAGTISNSKIKFITTALNEIADEKMKYSTIELCLDVMAADGHADVNEIRLIKELAIALNIDYDELQKMKDQRIVGLTTATLGQSLEAMLEIDPNWSDEQIGKHLRTEFAKWNARLNNLTELSERENAQNMLNLIAEARSKYA